MNMPGHRVVLVREWDGQTTGSGCCGQLGGKDCEIGDGSDYAHNRREMETVGAVYRRLRASLPAEAVELTIVDPRNITWLLPALARDARRAGQTWREVWGTLASATRRVALVVDGNVLASGELPPPDEAAVMVRRALSL